MKRTALILIVFSYCSFLFAAPVPSSFKRVLLPVTVRNWPGAFATTWRSDLRYVFYDERGHGIWPQLLAPVDCPEPCTISADLVVYQPGFPSTFGFISTTGSELPGSLLYVARDDFGLILLLTETATGDTVQLPVVRERDTFTGQFSLADLPTSARQRLALRIYNIDPELPARVRLRFFGSGSSRILAEREVALSVVTHTVTVGPYTGQIRPAVAQIADLANEFPILATSERIHIEITPLTTGTRIWAFASITDNVIQHVTLRTP
jgi:hypothetical protein